MIPSDSIKLKDLMQLGSDQMKGKMALCIGEQNDQIPWKCLYERASKLIHLVNDLTRKTILL